MKPPISNIEPIDFGFPELRRANWTLRSLSYGEETDWNLASIFACPQLTVRLTFEAQLSFRVTDEGDIYRYWAEIWAKSDEVGAFLIHKIGSSDFLDWFSSSSPVKLRLHHWLVGGSDDCLEVLSEAEPHVEILDQDKSR